MLGLVLAAPASAAAEVYDVPADRRWNVQGHGWGHGRGMSQWGTYAQASAGRSSGQILDFYYPGTTAVPVGNPTLRVRMTIFGGAPLVVSPQRGLRLVDLRSGTEERLPEDSIHLAWRVRSSPDGLHVEWRDARDGAWYPHPLAGAHRVLQGPLRFGTDTGAPLHATLHDGSTRDYQGTLLAVQVGGGLMNSVNALPMESYLRGVVPRESSPSWPQEALRAQSVAARTYAERARRLAPAGSEWDICDTTQCQVYDGVRAAQPSTDAAIAATGGLIRTYGGAPIDAQFSSSNGGWTVSGGTPYLPAREDPWDRVAANPRGTWTRTLEAATIEAAHPQVGTLRSLVVLRRDGHGEFGGRVLEVELVGVGGQRVRVTGEGALRFGMFSSWWRLTPTGGQSPEGNLEAVDALQGAIRVQGWALDRDTAAPVDVHVYVGGHFALAFAADRARADVATAYPGYGERHGFDRVVSAIAGTHEVCAFAIDTPGATRSTSLGCRSVSVSGDAFGSFEAAQAGDGSVTVVGWAIDPDTVGPAMVEVLLDGRVAARAWASTSRPDVGAVHPRFGAGHGYVVPLLAGAGAREVCVRVQGVGGGAASAPLGCRPAQVSGATPVGNIEAVTGLPGALRVVGWTIDPDVPEPVDVHVYVDGRFAGQLHADRPRADVAAVHPVFGGSHGVDGTVPAGAGRHEVCVFALNRGPGTVNPLLRCATVDVPGGNPFGNVEEMASAQGGVRVSGWVLDPDTADATEVHVYVDGRFAGRLTADSDRQDVGAAYPGYGPGHGFAGTVAAGPDSHDVCVFAINLGTGTANPVLRCGRLA